MPALSPHTVIVVGAGIAGLTAAWRLRRHGVSVRVLERESRPGGRMRTDEHDGFRIELGASILGTNYTRMLDLITELGIADQFGPANPTCGFLHAGKTHRLRATSVLDFLRTPLLGTRSKLALARALPELVRHRTRLGWDTMDQNTELDQLSVTEYARRHLTPEIHERICEPLFGGGIVLGSPDNLAAADMFFYATKFLVPHFNSPRGVGLLTQTLADRLPVTLNTTVTAVRANPTGASVSFTDEHGAHTKLTADAAIVTVPAPQAADILPDLPPDQAAYLRAVPYSRGLIVSYGLSRPPRETSPNIFTCQATHPDAAGVELHHNKIPGRVDGGRGLITVHSREAFVKQWWERDDADIAQRLLDTTESLLPGVRDTVITTHVNRRALALVVRPPGGYGALREFNARRRTANPRIQLAGDYFAPSSTYGALRSGEHAAARVLNHLLASPPPQPPPTGDPDPGPNMTSQH
ncbi:hypothetical protein BS329_20400 [Amycolatopsis coloradensis]|uniref:Amine oxidase domain-containing protein n=1 Tax=Amycolatopsis coloradensis TaxID=76021 RepID=A0A1R0KQT7_9PSEU|nr:NAD(P)/FAD-dependent oxidoreductase [Amycolatopsis coloradensis]OLZ49996.1 hypothetical protein BS329_20400 [Amycolatopsis coloradensis]